MNDVTLFAAALEKQSAAERSAFLDEACAGDAAMRQRVEALLHAHEKAGDYLERPAVEQMAEAAPASDATAALNTAGRPDSGEEEDAPLDFLQPSARPGSLGRLGHYEVLEVLGRGGFGIVLRAFDEMLHRVVAVKVMAPQLAATSPARKRFLREARASAAVRHDNVVAIYNVEEQPIPYLVMELIVGETVQQRLDRVGPLDAAEVARIGRQIAEGLAGAHAMGLIHRDIKPSNILLESGADRVKITDFGLARAADDASLTQSGVIAGTPMYMAPEQAKGEQIDQRADLFSLGSVLYVMCSGRPPFRASTTLAVLKRVAEDGPRPIREIIPEVPDWLCAIIAKLHAKEPAERFQTATEVAEILKQRPQPSAIVGPPIVRPDPPVPAAVPSRRGVWSAALAVMAVALTAVAGVFLALQGGDRRDPPADPGVALVKPGEQQLTKLGPEPWQPRPPLTQEELNRLPSPLDGRKRSDIPPELLARAGGGDPAKAPAELVAVLGNAGPFAFPRWARTHQPAVSPDGKWLAVMCDNDLVVFDAATGAVQRTLTGATQRLTHPVFAADGKRIGAGSEAGNAYVWETASGKLKLILEGHPDHVHTIAFSHEGKRIATGCRDGSLFLWDADGQNKTPLAKQPQEVDVVTFSADDKTLASAGFDRVVVLWDTATGMEVRSLRGHTANLYSLRYSPDGRTLASGGTGKRSCGIPRPATSGTRWRRPRSAWWRSPRTERVCLPPGAAPRRAAATC